MNLVIVESPAKGRTIEKYLGKDYQVVASFGHVRDLPKHELGVDTEHDFQPKYVIPPKSRKTISYLKKSINAADDIYLATDYDREGEAIAWHIIQATGLQNQKSKIKNQKLRRITFHEITKDAIQEAIKHPRDIDMNLVDAQQARRILDRLVGYKLSPLLWRKIYRGLSAGRVQSVAVRLIVEREREIADFKAEEYWTVVASLLKIKNQKPASPAGGSKIKNDKFEALLVGKDGRRIEKLAIKSEKEAKNIISDLEKAEYKIKNIEQKTEERWPYAPFTTSTLQQEAVHKLSFSAKKTMKIAQDLYEQGLITYMRTDSTNLAWLAINSARKLIEREFGKDYLPEKAKVYKTKAKAAQEAHEAIRPTYIQELETQNSKLKTYKNFGEDHQKLYELIWRRMVACQMNSARIDAEVVDIDAKGKAKDLYNFQARGSKIAFDGFSKVWPIAIEEKTLPLLKKDELLKLLELIKEQHFTKPPARYTEASLVKALEERGIGRPSTYAPIISTIQDRGYVRREQRYFCPQEIGCIVTDLLLKHFPDIVDIDFTAKMEEDLDKIAEGKENWVKTLSSFYGPFAKNLNAKYEKIHKGDIVKQEETKELCPKCGKAIVIRLGRYGKFLACSGFPECKYTKQLIIKTGLKCPDCKKGDVIERKTKKGKVFWGCSGFPKCKWASWSNPNKLPASPAGGQPTS